MLSQLPNTYRPLIAVRHTKQEAIVRSQIKLGRIFNIPIGLHYSWFLIAFLIVASLAAQFRTNHPEWSDSLIAGIATLSAVLFFFSLLLHELSHSLYARSHGLAVREITLFALGGVSQIEKEATSARTEFWMALVGPLTSALIGLVCLAVRTLTPAGGPAYEMFSWLGYINLALAAFNMVPGYPLDGGRILRAAIWWKSGDMERSTRVAARVGQVAGMVFIALGILQFFAGVWVGGLWIAFIGWFVLQAARESYLQGSLEKALQGTKVSDLMSQDCVEIDGNTNVQSFVDEWLLHSGNRCFTVTDRTGVVGLVTLSEIKSIERPRWPYTTLHDIMRPLEGSHTIAPEAPLRAALEIMGREDMNQVPVVKSGHVVGVLSRANLINYLRMRTELGT